jgi:RsiW-degrading membrane proteinase PrsW (M82 family)
VARPVSTRNAALYWSLFAGALTVMLVCCMLSFGADLMESGALAILAAVAAIMPVPAYVGLFLWLDRFEPEPPHLLVGAFGWGAGIAGLFACLLNSIAGLGLAQVMNEDIASHVTASLVAPPIEETLKGSVVLILFFWRKAEFDGITDGIIYAGMAALGFAMIENISYYGRAMNEGWGTFSITFIVRGILSPYVHVLFTTMTGIGFGIARQSKVMPLRIAAPLMGWVVAIGLHFMWNTIPLLGPEVMLVAYVFFWLPMFCGLLAIMIWSLRRESKIIRSYLLQDVGTSQILPADAHAASQLLPRLMGNMPVLLSQGWEAWKKIRRFQQAGTALAFYRHRLASGLIPADPALEAKHVQEFLANRQAVRQAPIRLVPPPIPPLPQRPAQPQQRPDDKTGPDVRP